jgi:hypothetical protein
MMHSIRRAMLLFVLAAWATSAQAQARVERNVVYRMYSGWRCCSTSIIQITIRSIA